jgi:hypothetical protein
MATTVSKRSAELSDHCKSNKTTGRIKNRTQPVALCKIETKALIGKRIVNKLRFFGRAFCALALFCDDEFDIFNDTLLSLL